MKEIKKITECKKNIKVDKEKLIKVKGPQFSAVCL